MVDLEWKTKMMISSDLPGKSSPRISSNKLQILIPQLPVPAGVADLSAASDTACSTYEHYLRLPELKKLWSCKDFPGWRNESVLKPALQGLEITFRFLSTVLADPRPYANRREWTRRLESLTTSQIEIIASLCEDEDDDGAAPVVLARENNSAAVVNRISEASLLPKLATLAQSRDVAQKIIYTVECAMRRCPYTIGVGEPNLIAKPILDYDSVCKPSELDSLKKPQMNLGNYENQTLYTVHQILESWIQVSKQILTRLGERIGEKQLEKAASDCWLVERTWRLLSEIEDLHLLMDPDDFLRLKNQLSIKATEESELFCFRSRGLIEITKMSKDLKDNVPTVLDVEVDPYGGPRIQEAAMRLYKKQHQEGGHEKIQLLQGMQAVEMGLKKFYYSYKQLLVVVMGSLEARGGKAVESGGDLLAQIFMEPTYFPSLDGAKTFLGDSYWSYSGGKYSPERNTNREEKN